MGRKDASTMELEKFIMDKFKEAKGKEVGLWQLYKDFLKKPRDIDKEWKGNIADHNTIKVKISRVIKSLEDAKIVTCTKHPSRKGWESKHCKLLYA